MLALVAVLFLLLVPFVVVETVGVALFAVVTHISRSQVAAATLAQLLTVTGLRAVALVGYSRWGRRRGILQVSYRFTRTTGMAIVASIPLGVLISNNFGIPLAYQPQFARTADYSITHFGDVAGVMITLAQYLYYASEGALIVFLTDAFQTLGEARGSQQIPWGGAGLAFTWGLLHLTTKGPVVTIAAVVTGLLVGTMYLLDRRIVWAPFVLWMAITIV